MSDEPRGSSLLSLVTEAPFARQRKPRQGAVARYPCRLRGVCRILWIG
jgi:hypothetical protein